MSTVYEFVYHIITNYIMPATNAGVEDYEQYVFYVCFALTIGILWTCFVRPFYLLFKYGLFGGSKRNALTRRRRDNDD